VLVIGAKGMNWLMVMKVCKEGFIWYVGKLETNSGVNR